MRRFAGPSMVLGAICLYICITGCGGGGSLTSSNSGGGPGPGPSPTPTPTPSPQLHSVSVSWTASTTAGVTSYNVYRSTVSGGPYTRAGNATSTSFTDSVRGGATYFYVVTALNASQVESAVSAEIKVTVSAP